MHVRPNKLHMALELLALSRLKYNSDSNTSRLLHRYMRERLFCFGEYDRLILESAHINEP